MTIQQTTPSPALAAPNEVRQHRRTAGPWFTRMRFLTPLALIAVVVVVAAVNGVGQTTTAPKAQAAALSADIGTTVRDGTFEFVVTGVEHPGKSFAGKYGKVLTAKGTYLIVRVTVTNLGDKERRLDSKAQFLMNDVGQKFQTSADILSTKDALKYVQWISPGSTVQGVSVLFDVAPGTMVLKIELHATPTSPGVRVHLL